MSGSLDGGVNKEAMPSGRCSPEGVTLEFGGETGRSGWRDHLDPNLLYFFSKI